MDSKVIARQRITPARAGSTVVSDFFSPGGWDHPRPRGEHHSDLITPTRELGSPPPARGAHFITDKFTADRRITPARAGSTAALASVFIWLRDHPRPRGEHIIAGFIGDSNKGSPPPARGARIALIRPPASARITPARAGSTPPARILPLILSDHPRPRGEHSLSDLPEKFVTGSPPPARGALYSGYMIDVWGRITPARAGSTIPLSQNQKSG